MTEFIPLIALAVCGVGLLIGFSVFITRSK